MIYHFLITLHSLTFNGNDTSQIIRESLKIVFEPESHFLTENDSLFRNNYGINLDQLDFRLVDVANKNGCELIKEDETVFIIDVKIISISSSKARLKLIKFAI